MSTMTPDEHRPKPGKRLALFFDGTWNKPENNTNVWRLALMLADKGEDGVPQEKFYDEGVGTHLLDRFTGGAFGYGLSENVRVGYRWLMERYNPGDEIFLFGFSRGAFTARSLAGVIARCGLLKPDATVGELDGVCGNNLDNLTTESVTIIAFRYPDSLSLDVGSKD